MSKVKDQLIRVLKRKKQVVTRAFFWKIPHNTCDDEVNLKLGRCKIPKEFFKDELPETLDPRSELTLDGEEFSALISLLQEQYEPFKEGVKAYIPLENPFDKDNAEQIRTLFSHENKQELVKFILSNDVIPDELEAGLRNAKRIKAIAEFKTMLEEDHVESVAYSGEVEHLFWSKLNT